MDISLAASSVGADGGALVVAELRDSPLSVDECLAAVSLPGAGGTALFVGTVRDHDDGRPVVELEYVAHPLAEREMTAVAREVADGAAPGATGAPASRGVLAVAVVHRTGLLTIGDIAVVAAASAAHRAEAFAACRQLIDEVKGRVPIWKRQLFADGTSEWVGACSSGHLR
ncbi:MULTISPECIES: molybdenum cofactor biosynthesis protein MoaE [Pseudofrankia]|uniref:molybdenum cofactor biosynthesis protein MoaE n=1 Tax=Pseudofrankia TaxID=2994363 RepID=UPI000234D12C|nr:MULTISPECIES: molybdenum cofactor biosynthesis protein MoaE [Pseudofrankia]OHV37429.1 molybdopterin synthase [Pseudofrankia sp. EUN1h]